MLVSQGKSAQSKFIVGALASAGALLLTGCSSNPTASTLVPDIDRHQQAAVNAATDPLTWVPLLGAAAFSLGDLDQRTVDWATDTNPVFGSVDRASEASDVFAALSNANYLVSAIATPAAVGQDPWLQKSTGLAVGLTAYGANSLATRGIKSATGRDRPYGNDGGSFPSRHTSGATIAATMAVRNIDRVALSDTQISSWQGASYAMAGMTGWARVEAGAHHPSDVLAGFALGHFLGAFFNDAFVPQEQQELLSLVVDVEPDHGTRLGIRYRW